MRSRLADLSRQTLGGKVPERLEHSSLPRCSRHTMAFLRSSSRFLTLLPFFTVGFVIGYCNVLPTLVTSRFLHISSAVSFSPYESTSRRRPPVKITLEPLPHPSSSSLALHVPAAPAPLAQQAHTDAFASVFTAQSAAALRTRQQLVSPPAPDLKATAESSLAAAVGRSSCKSLREWAVPLCRGALAATQALQVRQHSGRSICHAPASQSMPAHAESG